MIPRETRDRISYHALTDVSGVEAAARDQDGGFPFRAFEGLKRLGVIGNSPLRPQNAGQLFRIPGSHRSRRP